MNLPLELRDYIAKTDINIFNLMIRTDKDLYYFYKTRLKFIKDFFTIKIVTKDSIAFYLNKKFHREDNLPAIEWKTGSKAWYKHGVLHREDDLPAMEFISGSKRWYKDGKLHRLGDQPAIITYNNIMLWYKDGKKYKDSRYIKNLTFIPFYN